MPRWCCSHSSVTLNQFIVLVNGQRIRGSFNTLRQVMTINASRQFPQCYFVNFSRAEPEPFTVDVGSRAAEASVFMEEVGSLASAATLFPTVSPGTPINTAVSIV